MIGIVLDLLLAGLLLGALFYGARLNARLKSLRDSQAGFAAAAMELNGAIARAEAGLTEMRAASRDAEQGLMERVDEARLMVKRLHEAMERSRALPPARAQSPAAAPAPAFAPPRPRADDIVDLKDRVEQIATRSRARLDDDLFAEDESVPQMLQRLRAGAAR